MRVGVTQDQGAKGKDIVDELTPVYIADARAFAPIGEERLPSHRSEGADGRVHAAWKQLPSAVEQPSGILAAAHRPQAL